jgi:hypothetical protein
MLCKRQLEALDVDNIEELVPDTAATGKDRRPESGKHAVHDAAGNPAV